MRTWSGGPFNGIFVRAADRLATTYPNAAADLCRASMHWLRPTFANFGLDAGDGVLMSAMGGSRKVFKTSDAYHGPPAPRTYGRRRPCLLKP
ncbi:TPA: hypothetical protein QDC03_006681 [Burkholderia cepacia]|nr:hypothetical protein [Burkholderia cepacia]